MGSRYGEWISDVERPQSGAPGGGTPAVSGEVFVKLTGAASQSGYNGQHILYQDVVIPAVKDGTSNTLMVGEIFHGADGEYLLTSVQHSGRPGASGGEDSRGLWQINIQPHGDIQKGRWIMDASHEPSANGNAVAMETITIASEGILLLI